MMIELKPCPFCGGEVEYFKNSKCLYGFDVGWEFGIRCKNCGVKAPKENYKLEVNFDNDGQLNILTDERKKAADDWNRRVDNE